jgi:hypothetical protein
MTPAILTRTLLALAAVFAAACASKNTTAPLPSAECPIIMLSRAGGLGFRAQSGVLAAVWSSGTIVRSESAGLAGPNHFIGTLNATDVAALIQLAQSAKIWDHPRGQSVLDIADDILTLRRGSDVRQWSETPGFTTNSVVTEFRSTLFSLPVTGARAIDDKLDDVMKCAAVK